MEDPEDVATIDAIKKLTKLNPEILVAGGTAIKNAIEQLYERVKKSGEVESAISNIKVIPGNEEGGNELDLAAEKVSAKDAPFVKLVNLILFKDLSNNKKL